MPSDKIMKWVLSSLMVALFIFFSISSAGVKFNNGAWLKDDNPHKISLEYFYDNFSSEREQLILMIDLGNKSSNRRAGEDTTKHTEVSVETGRLVLSIVRGHSGSHARVTCFPPTKQSLPC